MVRREPSPLAVLAAIARGVLGAGYRSEVPLRMLKTLERLPSERDRKQLTMVLRALDTNSGALALTGRRVPVSWLSPAAAEALMIKWKSGRLNVHRQLAGQIIALSLSSLYGHPGPEWDRIGYQGPMGTAPKTAPRLTPIDVEPSETLRCDVVVIGSGAGGGCVAAGLAAAGYDVVVLEKGRYHSESDFHHYEGDAMRDMYLYGATIATDDLGCRIISGATLGGGTVVNYATAFRAPDYVLKEWSAISGIDAFVSGEIDESFDEVSERLNVNTDSSAAGRRDAVMEEGLKKLGWHVDQLPRAVKGCTQDEQCGYCGFGCRIGAKQSTMRTYLEDATSDGARIVVGAEVRRVVVRDGKATGVEAIVGGAPLNVNAKVVVSAGGSIETPALLLRSGLRGQVGHNLRLHPGTPAFAIFEDEVRIWEGTLQSRYSKEFAHLDDGYGPIFETVPGHPGGGSAALPWLGARAHREFMEKYPYVSFCAVLPRDKTAGRVTIAKDGSPRVRYKLQADDERRIADGVIAAGKVMEAAGAKEVFSGHANSISYSPSRSGAHDDWASRTRAAGYRNGKITFFSYHQMGSCRMGTNPGSSAVGPDNESHEVKGLYVVDGSTFPTASGVNPMLSIYAIANRASKKIAARLA
ncbi:MAG TPA: GMC family oxidoreductase [Actinomycetota bacterium]|nr:GMC family oxidoreductase [Actinomycetota bacterium]